MAFKMRYQGGESSPWKDKDGFWRTTWREIKDTFTTGKDSKQRRDQGRRHAHLMNLRNKSPEAIKYRKNQA